MIEVHVAELNKLSYLNGQTLKLDEENLDYSKWCTKDTIVRGWLLKTMELHLLGLFIDLPLAKKIWDGAIQIFYGISIL